MSSNKFYTTENYYLNLFDEVGQKYKFTAKTACELDEWKKNFRKELATIIGLDSMKNCDLNPTLVTEEKMDGYTRAKYTIETEPGVVMPFYALVPNDLKEGEKRPVIIAPHGHASHGKSAIVGETLDNENIVATIKKHNYDYGVQYVKEGFIVLCPDGRGFGERREKDYQTDRRILESSCSFLNNMAICLGQSVTGMWTWDLMRLVDYIETRDDVIVDKIGCAGLSGGGLQTLWLTALDDRIKACVISGYMYGYKQSLIEMGNCSCNYVPHLYELGDMGDIAALIMPRPVLFETGTKDDLNGRDGLSNVTSQIDKVKDAANVLGVTDNVYHDIFDGEHRWNGVYAIPWMKKYLF